MSIFYDLVFDIGVNKGEDTEFYLAKGFRVVGIEANPIIVDELWQKFRHEIITRRFTLLNIAITDSQGEMPFYINLDNDHWSSLDPAYGTRNGTKYEVIPVRCARLSDVLAIFGTPRYMKIDVEGADRSLVQQLRDLPNRPAFVSVEEYGHTSLIELREAGYDRFQIVPQRDKSLVRPPLPAREGNYVERSFTGYDSGLFGLELQGRWMTFEEVYQTFITQIRNPDHAYVGPEHEWHDIHATRADFLAG